MLLRIAAEGPLKGVCIVCFCAGIVRHFSSVVSFCTRPQRVFRSTGAREPSTRESTRPGAIFWSWGFRAAESPWRTRWRAS